MESDLAKSRVAGFNLHLIKPVALETLRDAIQRLAVGANGRLAGGAVGQDRR
jgi:hypothetical protein